MRGFSRTKGAAFAYVGLAALQRGVSLLILPFITHAMTPSQYGAASMLVSASILLTTVIAAPLVQLIIRAAARGDDDGPALLRVAGSYCYFVVPAVGALAAALVALLVPHFLGVEGKIWAIELLAVGFQPAASTFAMWVAQGREDIRRFVFLSSTSVLATAAFKLLFVVSWNLGVLGWVVSDLLSALLSALMAVLLVRLPRVVVGRDHVRYAVDFTLPLIPHNASLWALVFLSRPAMAAVSSLEQVGLLSFGLNLAQLAGIVLGETNRATLARYSRESFPAPTSQTLGPVRWQLLAAFAIPAIIGAGVAAGGQWLFAADYWPSFPLTGVLLVSQVAFGLYLIPMNYLTQTAGLPRLSSLASGAGALVIVVLILLLGGRYGAVGAAYATAAAYLMMAAVAMIVTVSLRLDIAWRSWLTGWAGLLLAAGALALGIAALILPPGSQLGWALIACCFVSISAATMLTARSRPAQCG